MKQFILVFCLVVCYVELNGQDGIKTLPGQVSYIGSQNVYVKFKSTKGISAGDTLYVTTNAVFIPVLKVNNLSSSSCVCTNISGVNLTIADLIIAKIKTENIKALESVGKNEIKEIKAQNDSASASPEKSNQHEFNQKIKGSISAYSYSDFSNTTASNSQRFRYTLSLDARNIANSKFSAESYISFRHKKGEWGEVKKNVFNALKIYDLAVRYDLNKTTQISLGRKINPKISNIGAADGLQVEKSVNNFFIGAIAGSRPDYRNYNFNINLLQFGAYLAYNQKKADSYSESSIAFMQQMNQSKTDRRFLYFQHSNSIIKNVYFFGTFEVDLYKLKNNLPQNTFNITGIYLSLRYKMTDKFTISGSYDARKNVMYYETYRTTIDSAFEKELRQGFRLQLNYRITKNLMFGLQPGYRYLKSDPHPSKNVYSYFTCNQVPGVNISTTISATYLETSYLNGKILGLNMSRDLLHAKVQTGIGYRYVDYRLPENLLDVTQNIAEMNLSWQFYKNMSLSLNYEGTFETRTRYNRIYFQIRKRF